VAANRYEIERAHIYNNRIVDLGAGHQRFCANAARSAVVAVSAIEGDADPNSNTAAGGHRVYPVGPSFASTNTGYPSAARRGRATE
jgi:hypothetical protein